MQTIGIIGAGQMGRGIAQVCAQAGYEVVLQDVKAEAVEAALGFIKAQLEKAVGKGKITAEEASHAVARIRPTTTVADFAAADLVIEAATENEQVKHSILKNLCAHLKPSALIASNTSSISITRLAAQTDRPERFVGIHFMNPVPVMQLVELIRGLATSDETYQTAQDFVARLGKTAALASDYPGFIVNRILLPMVNEAIYALMEGVGDATSIDSAMKLGTNQPMGPLELADFIGLDTCLAIMQVLHKGMGDSKYRPCPLLINYVEAGWLGRKSGRGFYSYAG